MENDKLFAKMFEGYVNSNGPWIPFSISDKVDLMFLA
jgi:hypothetical protein